MSITPLNETCSRTAPFDLKDFNAAIMRGLERGHACSYTCGGVFFWANHLWTPTPGVKVSRRSIDYVIEHHCKRDLPGKLPHPMVIGIVEDKCPVMEMKWGLAHGESL